MEKNENLFISFDSKNFIWLDWISARLIKLNSDRKCLPFQEEEKDNIDLTQSTKTIHCTRPYTQAILQFRHHKLYCYFSHRVWYVFGWPFYNIYAWFFFSSSTSSSSCVPKKSLNSTLFLQLASLRIMDYKRSDITSTIIFFDAVDIYEGVNYVHNESGPGDHFPTNWMK